MNSGNTHLSGKRQIDYNRNSFPLQCFFEKTGKLAWGKEIETKEDRKETPQPSLLSGKKKKMISKGLLREVFSCGWVPEMIK